MAGSIEQVSVKLPVSFDPARHHGALVKLIAQRHGEGFEIQHIDPAEMVAIATRQVAITEVTAAAKNKDSFEVRLARGTKPADGEKVAAKLEEQHAGYYLTGFEPFLGRATLTKMGDGLARCRGACAVALGVKPWDIQVSSRKDGGFDLTLPRGYVPSKHDTKLAEVAEIVGAVGWFVRSNPAKLTASIIPSAPPTFPEVVPTPMGQLGKDPDRTPIGMVLPKPGETVGDTLFVDWAASAHLMVAGTPGAGKSVTLNALIADQLASGASVAIADDPAKSIDFLWCKDFVRDGGWGCDSDRAAVATLALVYAEGQRRAKVLGESGYVNWLDMPKGKRFQPIFVIVDEVSALLVTDKIPSGVPKTHPLVQEMLEANLMKVQLASYISKIVAELRFVGVRMVLSTQVTNNNTGVPPSLKAKIGGKLLAGANPSKSARVQAFSDESAVPSVPENVKAGGKRSRGVGAADLEGQAPAVYKSYFASTQDYREHLTRLGVATTTQPAPTRAQIDQYTPTLDDDGSDSRPSGSSSDNAGWGAPDGRVDDGGPRLKGAADAAHRLKVDEQAFKRAQAAAKVNADVIAGLEDR
jgi:hypothetical protein